MVSPARGGGGCRDVLVRRSLSPLLITNLISSSQRSCGYFRSYFVSLGQPIMAQNRHGWLQRWVAWRKKLHPHDMSSLNILLESAGMARLRTLKTLEPVPSVIANSINYQWFNPKAPDMHSRLHNLSSRQGPLLRIC